MENEKELNVSKKLNLQKNFVNKLEKIYKERSNDDKDRVQSYKNNKSQIRKLNGYINNIAL